MIFPDQNDVATSLPDYDPTERLEDRDDLSSAESGKRRHSGYDLDLSCLESQRQAALRADFEAQCDGFLDVAQSLGPCSSLADATWNRGAFHNPCSAFVAVQSHLKAHLSSSFAVNIPSRGLGGPGLYLSATFPVVASTSDTSVSLFSSSLNTCGGLPGR